MSELRSIHVPQSVLMIKDPCSPSAERKTGDLMLDMQSNWNQANTFRKDSSRYGEKALMDGAAMMTGFAKHKPGKIRNRDGFSTSGKGGMEVGESLNLLQGLIVGLSSEEADCEKSKKAGRAHGSVSSLFAAV